MEENIVHIELDSLMNHISLDSITDKFNAFDNYSGKFDLPLQIDFPVKLDVMINILCFQGYLRIKVGHNDYLVEKNDIIVLLNGQIVQVLEMSDDFQAEFSIIKPEFYMGINEWSNLLNFRNLLQESPQQSLPEEKIRQLKPLMEYIKEAVHDKENIYRAPIIHNYLAIMFWEMYNLLLKKTEQKEPVSRGEEIFNNFIKDVEKDFRKERSIAFYADKACLSPKHFSTSIYKITGKHATDWINEYSIFEAKALLKSTYKPIQEISDELGFATLSHFSTFFRQHTGMSPRKYRKN